MKVFKTGNKSNRVVNRRWYNATRGKTVWNHLLGDQWSSNRDGCRKASRSNNFREIWRCVHKERFWDGWSISHDRYQQDSIKCGTRAKTTHIWDQARGVHSCTRQVVKICVARWEQSKVTILLLLQQLTLMCLCYLLHILTRWGITNFKEVDMQSNPHYLPGTTILSSILLAFISQHHIHRLWQCVIHSVAQ